jgi:tetratricopeptide (TPR) repeat protein
MAFCGNCGRQDSGNGKFCRGCGHPLGASAPPPQQVAAVPPPPAPQPVSQQPRPPQAGMPQTAKPPAAPADPRRKKIILLAAAAVVLLGVWMTLVHFRVWPFHHIGGRLEIAALTTEQVAGKAKVGKPTAAERQLYTEYAQRVKRYASVRMSRSERASGSALAALVHMQAKGETIQGRDGFTARAKELAEGEAKVESSFFGRVRSWFLPLVVVFADDSGGADEAQYSAGLMNNVANVQMLQGQFYNPLLFAALASIADPDNPNVCVTLANLLKDAGDYDNAIATVQYGLKLNPKSETLLYTGGMISLERKELQDAENYFMTAMNISGGPGPSNQGMMLVSMARKDYGSAFLFMLEGGRDSFTMPVWRVYQKLRLKPNYFKMSGAIFDQLGLANLMDLSRTRTGRKPKFDALTQGIEIDHRFNFPSSAADLNRSGDQMALDTIKYIQGTAKYYEEDANQLKEAFDILSAGSLKDMYGRFKASSLAPKAKTKAEMQVNWYREEFWLCILNDYFAWEKKKIADQFKKDSEAADGFFDKFGLHLEDVYDKYYREDGRGAG